jgi:hypothetical protein
MSADATANVMWAFHKGVELRLSAVARSVLQVIASHCQGSEPCALSWAFLSAEACVAERSVTAVVDRLQAVGLIRIERSERPARGRANRYWLNRPSNGSGLFDDDGTGANGQVVPGLTGAIEQVVLPTTGAIEQVVHRGTGANGMVVAPRTHANEQVVVERTGANGGVVEGKTGANEQVVGENRGGGLDSSVPGTESKESKKVRKTLSRSKRERVSGTVIEVSKSTLEALTQLRKTRLFRTMGPVPGWDDPVTLADLELMFTVFWREYPRKLAKRAAAKAFIAALLRTECDDDPIMDALIGFEFSEDERFIKYPSGWLNDGHWLEYLPEPMAPPASPQSSLPLLAVVAGGSNG